MDRAFEVIGAVSLSVAAGALLATTTPTAMKAAPEPAWRLAARAANAGHPVQLSHNTVVYSGMPEDLSTEIGYGSPAAYEAFYVNAPIRSEYTAVPDYSPAGLNEQRPTLIAADAAALAARDARDAAASSPQPVQLASAKTVDFGEALADPGPAPVPDTSGDAPAMAAASEDE